MKSKPTRTVPPDSYLPAADFLLLDVAKEEEITEGGIIRPECARPFLHEGKILKVGPQVSKHLQKGMFVVFSPASEFRLEIEKDVFVTAVAEPNIILYRDPLQPLFPIPAADGPIKNLKDLPPAAHTAFPGIAEAKKRQHAQEGPIKKSDLPDPAYSRE